MLTLSLSIVPSFFSFLPGARIRNGYTGGKGRGGQGGRGARGEGGKGRGGKGGGKSNHRHVASNLNIQSWSAGKDTLNVSYF